MTLDTSRGRRDGHAVARLFALESFAILDTPPEPISDGLTAVAAYVCGVPMAAVTFVDAEREWIESRHGFHISEIPRERSLALHTMAALAVVKIPDTHRDSRCAAHPMVTGNRHVPSPRTSPAAS